MGENKEPPWLEREIEMLIDFEFNGSTARQNGLMVEKFLSIPTSEQRITKYTLPGRDGDLTYIEPGHDDIVISAQLLYLGNLQDLREKYHDLKRWLLKGAGLLKFLDQGEWHYVVKSVKIGTNELAFSVTGRFTVDFTCAPHQYLDGGDIPVDVVSVSNMYNPYDVAHPTYELQGEGMCTLTVNGKTFTANVGQNLIINTELMISYRIDGEMRNTSVNGEYENLYLQPGNNLLSVTNGFDVKITPNWRRL